MTTTTLTKIEIVDAVSPSVQDRVQIERTLMKIFAAMTEALAEGRKVQIHNYGIFEAHRVAPRQVRNPRTGEVFEAPAKTKIRFKPSKALLEALNS